MIRSDYIRAVIVVGAALWPCSDAMAQPAAWNGGNGNWTTAALWTPAVVPDGNTFDVTIAAAGTYTVTLDSIRTVNTLDLNNASATLLVTGGRLNLNTSATLNNGVVQLSAGTILGGMISAGAGRVRPDFSTSTLSGVSLGIDVLDMSGGRIVLTNGTTLTGGPGVVTLGNSSQIFFRQASTIPSGTNFALRSSSSISADGGFTVTLDAATTDTVTVNILGSNAAIGAGFQDSAPNSLLINKGRVQFDPATVGAIFNVSAQGAGSRFRNEGRLVASSAGAANTINLSGGQYTNAGTIVAATGGIVNLNGTFTRAELGMFTNTGGTINLFGTLNNTNLDLDSTTGPINLTGGTIVGGTVTAAGTGRLKPGFTASTLNGVSLGVNVLDMSAGRIALTNGTILTGGPGTIPLGSSSQIFINQPITIPSGIVFALGSNSSVSADGFSVTLDAATTDTVTVNVLASNAAIGAGFQSNAASSILINKGRVQFDPATAGATLNISAVGTGSRFRNEGQLIAGSTGAANTINLAGGQYTNAGTIIAATGGIVNLNGTFTRAELGTFTNTGGTINIVGTLNNTALDLDNTTGSINITTGTIVGGTVSAMGTARLRPNFSTSTLNGVSLGVNVLDMSGGRVQFINGTTFTGGPGTITLGSSSQIFIGQAATIPSGTNFALGANSSVSADGGFSVTLDAATTDTVTVNVLGSNSAIGGGFQSSAPNSILINKGRVQFDPATLGASLNVGSQGAGSRFRNEGKLVAGSAGAANTINLSGGQYTNAGTIIAATGGIVNLNGTFTRAELGTFTNTGGTINIVGTLNNTALDLDNTTGSINITTGTIVGGTVSATGTARLRPNFSTSTLNGVSLGVNVLDMSGGRVQFINGTTFTGGPGTITLGSSSQIFIGQAATIPSGTNFALGANSSVSADGGFSVTLDAATTDTVTVNVLGSNSAIGGGFQSSAPNSILINKGRVQFDPATVGATLNVSALGAGSRFRNEGNLVAGSAGAANTMNLNGGQYTNAGTIIAATGGIVNLNGTFTRAELGTFTNTGGTINLVGTLNNTSLDLDSITGPIVINGGTIVGGTVTATGTGRLKPNFVTNTLNGVSLGVNVLDMSAGRLTLTNGTNFTNAPGVIALGNSSQVFFAETITTPSGISFDLGPNSSVSAEGFTATLGAATPATRTVRVAAGILAAVGTLGSGPNSVLVNQGTIDFAGTGATLNIGSNGTGSRVQNDGIITANFATTTVNVGGSPTTLTNAGSLSVINGGTINIPANTSFTNYDAGTQTLTGGRYEVYPSSVINFNGRTIVTVSANTSILMDGNSSVFTAANSITTNNGSLSVGNGKLFTVAGGTLTNGGTLTVGTTQGDLATLTGNVISNTGSTVKGTGKIVGALTLASGSTLAPGGSPGILNVTGAVSMTAGTTVRFDLSGNAPGTGYSQLVLTGGGSANLNSATLAFSLNYAPNETDFFTLVSGGPVAGIFNGLPDGAQVNLGVFNGVLYKANIAYGPTTVLLTNLVPEPAHMLALGALAGSVLAGLRKRCRFGSP